MPHKVCECEVEMRAPACILYSIHQLNNIMALNGRGEHLPPGLPLNPLPKISWPIAPTIRL